jgi:tetratricopeptide (TPR) repeat protein
MPEMAKRQIAGLLLSGYILHAVARRGIWIRSHGRGRDIRMAKAKKKPGHKPAHKPGYSPARRMSVAEEKAMADVVALITAENWAEAHGRLLNLERRLPSEHDVFALLFQTSIQTQDDRSLLRAAHKLAQLHPDEPSHQMNLAVAYGRNNSPAQSLLAYERYAEKWPDRPEAEKIRETLETARPKVAEMLEAIGLKMPGGLETAALHEDAQRLIDAREYTRARELSEAILRTTPTFAAAANHISLSYLKQGEIAKSADASKRTLTIDPENVYALANLVYVELSLGREEEALAYADRLKLSKAPAIQRELKIATTMSTIGDHAGAIAAYERALVNDETLSLGPTLTHYAAAAHCFLGNADEARRLWQLVLTEAPGFELATGNLADLDLPEGERHGPWAIDGPSWYLDTTKAAISAAMSESRGASDMAVQRAFRRVTRQHPEIVALAPWMLALADASTTKLVISFARLSAAPEMVGPLSAFAGGPRGSDSLRRSARDFIAQIDPEAAAGIQVVMRGRAAGSEPPS